MKPDPLCPRHLWIFGLRRSGTTAIWQMFRGLHGFNCFDEPFNPKLKTQLPTKHRKGTWDEFVDLWHKDHAGLTQAMATIGLSEEVSSRLALRELDYLRYLNRTPTIIDFTRLNFKVDAVLAEFPDIVALLLYRSPVAFATSHIINSENRKFLRQRYYRAMFFSASIGFDSWGIETNIKSPGFSELMEYCSIIPRKPPTKLKSVEKLLLFWLTARRSAELVIGADSIGRTFAASYEDIIDGKSDGFDDSLKAVGIDQKHIQTNHLRSYSLGYRHDDPVWFELASNSGFSDHEIQKYIMRGTK